MNKNRKYLAFSLVAIILIVSTLSFCRGGDDDVSDEPKTAKPSLPIDKKLQARADSFVVNQSHVGSLGLWLYDLDAGTPVYQLAADTPMRPASCLKLLTCAAAMRRLGIDYHYRTRLYVSGRQEGDTLQGDLILKTHFDPTFNRDSLTVLLSALKPLGIKAVKGRVLLDMAVLQPMEHEQHWTPGDLRTRYLGLLYQGYPRMRREVQWGLQSIGVRVASDSIRFGRMNPIRVRELACISTPLTHVVSRALKFSSNINAESLLYPLGYTYRPSGDVRDAGLYALSQFVEQELHMNPRKFARIDDGCGLCPDNHLSPSLLGKLLIYISRRPSMLAATMEALPLSGTDGTLYDRLRKPHVVGQVRAKTGTLTREGGISTLAGFYTAPNNGHRMAFVIMNNACPVLDGRWWQDRFVERALLPKELMKSDSVGSADKK